VASNAEKLRSGYTTGACAAAAAKAAAMLLLRVKAGKAERPEVEIPFPDGSRVKFAVHHGGISNSPSGPVAFASVIKDAGDDPDVTNGAEIIATVQLTDNEDFLRSSLLTPHTSLIMKGGRGVGTVTKPGLSVPVGEPAINPVPRRMIQEAVTEAVMESAGPRSLVPGPCLVITISVPKGEELAKKTLNSRLGIIGGISILGTSGIVRPLSTEAWTSSITASMDVAKAAGLEEIVLSVGRISEKAHMKKYALPEESYIMMGDYFEFSLTDARKHDFKKIHISAHWAKMLKISMATPQTHVRHGAIDIKKGTEHLNRMGIGVPRDRDFNTAREIYDYLAATYRPSLPMLRKVCMAAKEYAEGIAQGIPVMTHLVSYDGDIIVDNE
jgi:cobalt-precorrin-5B (C1)-methyltransferase